MTVNSRATAAADFPASRLVAAGLAAAVGVAAGADVARDPRVGAAANNPESFRNTLRDMGFDPSFSLSSADFFSSSFGMLSTVRLARR